MSEPNENESGKGFKVQDRRRFTEEGDVRESQGEGTESEPAGTGTAETPPPDENPLGELPPINFSTFIISLSTQALMHLGEIPHPTSGAAEKDIPVAKQTIDIIAMLGEKSRGNLDDDEAKLLNEILYSLRMKYVEAVRQK